MTFLFPLFGAIVGAIGGFAIGEMLRVGYESAAFDARLLLSMVGVLPGYFAGRVLAGRPASKRREA